MNALPILALCILMLGALLLIKSKSTRPHTGDVQLKRISKWGTVQNAGLYFAQELEEALKGNQNLTQITAGRSMEALKSAFAATISLEIAKLIRQNRSGNELQNPVIISTCAGWEQGNSPQALVLVKALQEIGLPVQADMISAGVTAEIGQERLKLRGADGICVVVNWSRGQF